MIYLTQALKPRAHDATSEREFVPLIVIDYALRDSTMHRTDPTVTVRALKSAAPYIRMYKGKVFVIKASGGVFGDPASTRALMEQVAILHQVGIRVVVVHGGGPQLTEIQQ